jgi:hypothetical protein
MANQDWNNLPDPERQRLEAEEQIRAQRAVRPSGGFAWGWIWFIIIIVVFVWLLGWGWGSYGGGAGWGGKRQIVAVQPGQIIVSTNVPQLLSNPVSYQGKQVLLPGAKIQQVVNDRAVWVGPTDNQKILVTVASNSPMQKPSQGQKVDVAGTATKASGNSQVDKNVGLSANDRNEIKGEGIYVVNAVVAAPGQLQLPQGQAQNR